MRERASCFFCLLLLLLLLLYADWRPSARSVPYDTSMLLLLLLPDDVGGDIAIWRERRSIP